MKETYDITGMTCAACSSRVEKSVSSLPGIEDVSVNLLKNSMTVVYDESRLSSQSIIQAVTKAGYGASLRGAKTTAAPEDAARAEYTSMRKRVLYSFLFAVPLFYLAMGHMMGWPLPAVFLGNEHAQVFALTQFLLLLPILFVNRKYFEQGGKALLSRSPNMDSLVALGSGASVIHGVYALYKIAFASGAGDLAAAGAFAHDLYFDGAGTILTLITLGKYFETRAKGRTSEAVNALLDLAPKTANVLRNGEELPIPAEELIVGDIAVVRSGESIPADGVVLTGHASIDESAVTGESIPADKRPGDTVIGATVNVHGYFQMKATKVGSDTALAQIIRLVDEATSSKAPIAKLADRVASIFVPTVIAIAVIAAAVWLAVGADYEFALTTAVSILVISCPCALGLATPTAIMVGTGLGARHGILIKSAEALEAAQSVQTVVLDKTGTVTYGKPAVTDIICAGAVSTEELLRTAISLESLSSHPLASAIKEEAGRRSIIPMTAAQFKEIPGQGIRAVIDGKECLGGNRVMMEAFSVHSADLSAEEERLAQAGKTPLFFAAGGTLLGIIACADEIKPTSRQAVEKFHALGMNVVLLSGDKRLTAEAIGGQIDVDEIIAEVLPQDKEQHVRRLQEKGIKTAMVGDGINDAPALARSDVGIAIGAGTDVAMESADIVLMKSDLLDAAGAVELSRAVVRNIKQNLFWAFFYNVLGIPIAAGCFYTLFGLRLNPMIAALAMSFSSVFVVSNALRLRFFRPSYASGIHVDEDSEEHHTPPVCIISSDKGGIPMKKIITVEGMMCQHCVQHVTKALSAVPGVSDVSVSLEAGEATVTAAPEITEEALRAAVKDAGYTAMSVRDA